MKSKNKFFSNPLAIGIIGSIIASIILRLIDNIFGTELLNAMSKL